MSSRGLEDVFSVTLFVFQDLLKTPSISYITKRYAKANNKYMNDYDPRKPSTFISYLDMNNLYSCAIGEYLPYEEFEWLKNVGDFDVMSVSEKVQ